SIFCDHSDVMAVRSTGWAMLFVLSDARWRPQWMAREIRLATGQPRTILGYRNSSSAPFLLYIVDCPAQPCLHRILGPLPAFFGQEVLNRLASLVQRYVMAGHGRPALGFRNELHQQALLVVRPARKFRANR